MWHRISWDGCFAFNAGRVANIKTTTRTEEIKISKASLRLNTHSFRDLLTIYDTEDFCLTDLVRPVNINFASANILDATNGAIGGFIDTLVELSV